jgi:hypothetical protein
MALPPSTETPRLRHLQDIVDAATDGEWAVWPTPRESDCTQFGNPMQLDQLRAEIERMRTQVHRQRGEIRQLQRAAIYTVSAEALLERMLTAIDGMCAERDKLKKQLAGPTKGKVIGGRS